MRIVFVRPNVGTGRCADALEPVAFAVLAGLTPPDVELALYDDRIETVPLDLDADLIAITCDTFCARRAYELAGVFRRRGIPVVMGGFHPTLCPEEAGQHADAIVVGDAEGVWPHIVADCRHGRLLRRYDGDRPELAGIRPDRRIFLGKSYGQAALVQFGRGCPHRCEFCSIRIFYGPHLRHRPVDDVIAEIEGLPDRLVVFADDNLFADPRRGRQLLQRLVPLRIGWAAQIGIDAVGRSDLLELMAASGCVAVTIGFESMRKTSLRQMGKAWNSRHGDYGTVVEALRARGIMVYGTFVFGYDHDTRRDVEAAYDFALRSKLFLANFNPLMPLPGTPLHARLRREGRLLDDPWWLKADYRWGDVAFRPAGMTAAELAGACADARRRFNRRGTILRRAFDLRANLSTPTKAGLFLAANLASRRELRRKQGRPLTGRGSPESEVRSP